MTRLGDPTQPASDPEDHAEALRTARRMVRLLALVAAVWAILYLPYLGTGELDDEEGRRFLPAQAMLESGDQILPTIYERPYLSKPPLHYWLIEACSAPLQAVSTWSTRLPSALSTLLIAGVLFTFSYRRLGLAAASAASLVWLVTPLAVEKGTLGELESPLALFVTFAVACLFAGWENDELRRRTILPGGVVLGCAVLTKGPAAWVFLGAAWIGAIALDPRRWRRSVGPALSMLAISAAIGGAWTLLLVQRLSWAELQATWSEQVVGTERGLADYLDERWTYARRAFAGLLPGSLFALAFVRKKARESAPALIRFALFTALAAAVFFLVWPRSKARYLFPAAPWLALVAGYVVARAIETIRSEVRAPGATLARRTAVVVGAAGALAGLLCLVDRFAYDFVEHQLNLLGVAIATALFACGGLAIARARSRDLRVAFLAAFGVLGCVRLLHATQVIPFDARADARAATAREIDAALPPGAPAFMAHWGAFNLMAYLPRRVVWTEAPAEGVPPGIPLLFATRDDEPPPEGVTAWPELGRWPLPRGRTLHAVLKPRSE